MNNDEIIHVAHITLNVQMLLSELVEHVQHYVCPPLRGETTNGQAGLPAWNDVPAQRQGALAADAAGQNADQDGVANACKVPSYVGLKAVGAAVLALHRSQPLLGGGRSGMQAASGAAGVAVVDKPRLPDRLDSG